MTPKFSGKIEGGKLKLDNPHGYLCFLSKLEGARVDVAVARHKEDKTAQQMGYLFGVCFKLISEHTGYTIREVEGLMKDEFLPFKTIVFRQRNRYISPSLADIKRPDLSRFIDDCIMLAASHWGIVIPPPNEVYI